MAVKRKRFMATTWNLKILTDNYPNIWIVWFFKYFINSIFRNIIANIGDFTSFVDFPNLIKLQILKWLSNPNGSCHLLETRDSGRFLSKYLNAPKKLDFIIPIFRKIVANIGDFTSFVDFPNLTKLQILKWLSNPNGLCHLLETRDSERFLSK